MVTVRTLTVAKARERREGGREGGRDGKGEERKGGGRGTK